MEISEQFIITEQMVKSFADLVGDKNPIHLDPEYARQTIFGRCIVHGMFISSFFSRLIAERYPGPGSIYLGQNIRFLKPCFVGDTIEVKLILEELTEGEKKNLYKIKTQIFRGFEQLVDGIAEVMLRK